MKTITKDELLEKIRNIRGASFITFISETDPRMVKKHRITKEPNPFLGAVKVSRINAIVNFTYENSVNNQRRREDKETDFEAQERKWGSHEESNHVGCIVEHKGKKYISVKPEKVLENYFKLNDKKIDKIDPGYLPVKKPQLQQGLEKEVIYRNYSIDSIKAIRISGEDYIVI